MKKKGEDDETYFVGFKVANSIRGYMKVLSSSGEIQFSESMMSTRMGVPPALRESESFVTEKIPLMNMAEFLDEKLIFKGPDGIEASFIQLREEE